MRIELRDIHKYYGSVAANVGIGLDLEPGRIYGLLGENGAGKSTLMRIVAGQTRPSRGSIRFDGTPALPLNPQKALALGVGMLAQDPQDFPALKVWENFRLGGRRRSRREAVSHLRRLCHRFHFRLDPESRVAELTVGERQQLEMLRLLDQGVQLLILDEPTTGITLAQKDMLFQTVKALAAEGKTIVFVSHKLAEVQGLCHQVVVLRRGRLVAKVEPPWHEQELVQLMFGAEAVGPQQLPAPPPSPREAEVVLRLEDVEILGDHYGIGRLGLELRAGEVVGLAGLEGSGQELFLRGLAGLARVVGGRLCFDGLELQGRPYLAYKRAGIHFLPAARLEQGLFPELSLRDHFRLAFANGSRDNGTFCEQGIQRFRIQATPSSPARSLSGGNQQRLLLALIPERVRLLLLEHPTRGLDMESARLVWHHLANRCQQRTAVVFSSADLDELKTYSHRILVFYNRELMADRPAADLSIEQMGRLMAGQAATG